MSPLLAAKKPRIEQVDSGRVGTAVGGVGEGASGDSACCEGASGEGEGGSVVELAAEKRRLESELREKQEKLRKLRLVRTHHKKVLAPPTLNHTH